MALLERHVSDGIARIVMNAPERLNALSNDMLAELTDALNDIAQSDARVVILSGVGKAFCAGHDLKEMQAGRQAEDKGADYFASLFDRCATMMKLVQSIPQPVIAQVHGFVYIVYLAACAYLWLKMKWGIGRAALLASGGVIPGIGFWIEHKVTTEVRDAYPATAAADAA